MSKCIVWLRQDLRLRDNPALYHACEKYDQVLPVYILDDETPQTKEYGDRRMGGAQRWWLHHSLMSLEKSFHTHHVPLILRRGKASPIIKELIKDWGAEALAFNYRYAPWDIEHDTKLQDDLESDGVTVHHYKGNLLMDPWEVETKSTGKHYTVYTPFWKNIRPRIMANMKPPLDVPTFSEISDAPDSDSLDDWALLPTNPDWSGGFDIWTPGEDTALNRLDDFIDDAVKDYDDKRDIPSVDGTSRLSPHLAFGEISPRLIWHKTRFVLEETHDDKGGNSSDFENIDCYLSEIAWREFAYHLLYHEPKTVNQPLRDKYKKVPWTMDDKAYDRWCHGQTGIPIIDAGMRQLWQTGWMHNRVRMLVGSLLVKNMLIPWQKGEEWFWDTLVDADQASNILGWQWVAGSGADAAPYFRVFNPVTQGERYDKGGDYIREFVPEIKDLPNKYIHKPWEAPDDVLHKAGIKLGDTYPRPIVDLKTSRQDALDAYAQMKS